MKRVLIMNKKINYTTNQIYEAISVVNKHAKTAILPKQLYQLKKLAINKLLLEQKAEKVGLHFTNNPKNNQQHSVTLVKCGSFYFHIPSVKEDFTNLIHLGKSDVIGSNPKVSMSVGYAKKVLMDYTNYTEPKKTIPTKRKFTPYVFKRLGE